MFVGRVLMHLPFIFYTKVTHFANKARDKVLNA